MSRIADIRHRLQLHKLDGLKAYLNPDDVEFLLKEFELQEKGRLIALQALHDSSDREVALRDRLHKNGVDGMAREAKLSDEIARYQLLRIEAIEYCEPHLDQMWAASIVGILLNCDFRDAKQALAKWRNKE